MMVTHAHRVGLFTIIFGFFGNPALSYPINRAIYRVYCWRFRIQVQRILILIGPTSKGGTITLHHTAFLHLAKTKASNFANNPRLQSITKMEFFCHLDDLFDTFDFNNKGWGYITMFRSDG